MNAYNLIISKQIEWAKNRHLQLVGSHWDKGLKRYTTRIEDNLFQPLNEETKENLVNGDGGELSMAKGPAKICAVHSSSALGINFYDYWRKLNDISIITSSCGLSRAGLKFSGDILFEQKFSIDDHFQYSPNIDVLILPKTGKYKAFAIECKFTEAYSSRKHAGLKHKYLEIERCWQNLPAIKSLAEDISPDDRCFDYLHAAQLIKHILGLNRKYGHACYRFLYLWYDALGEPGCKHRKEIEEFANIVRSDGVIFHETTYQDLIVRLARYREDHWKYVSYLTKRYL